MNKYTFVVREADPHDVWDRDSTDSDWDFGDASLSLYQSWSESFDTKFNFSPGDKCYLVVPVWSTGDSFGHDGHACAEIFGVFHTYDEAVAFSNDLRTKGIPKGLYKPWEGYFESLDSIEILERILKP